METPSTDNAIIGGLFMVVGVLMIVCHRQLREFDENFHQALPEALRALRPRGRLLTIFIIVFGALAFLGGTMVLVANLVEL